MTPSEHMIWENSAAPLYSEEFLSFNEFSSQNIDGSFEKQSVSGFYLSLIITFWLPLFFNSQVNSLHVVVGSLLFGSVILVVGLVQLAPGAEAAQNSTALIGAGCALLSLGALLAQLRILWIKRQKTGQKDGTHQRSVTSIDMLLAQHR